MIYGHTDYVRTVDFNHDGSLLASGSDDTNIMIIDTSTGNVLRRIVASDYYITSISFNHDGSRIASCSEYGKGEAIK